MTGEGLRLPNLVESDHERREKNVYKKKESLVYSVTYGCYKNGLAGSKGRLKLFLNRLIKLLIHHIGVLSLQ